MDVADLLIQTKERGGSDLHLSTGAQPLMRLHGHLTPMDGGVLSRDTVHKMIYEILNDDQRRLFEETRDLDFAIEVGEVARFRVNVFNQRNGEAAVFRVIPTQIRSFQELGMPEVIQTLALRENGLVLVTGPTGSGKSSTLAAVIDKMNSEKAFHILTIEDPIEFLHRHKKATVHQRELYTDTPTFAAALRSALRQAPKVILVGEMRDRETIEIALTAAETGHLVFSTLHTIDASKTVERIVGTFEAGDQQTVRTRLAATFRYFISQRLIPKKGGGRIPIIEMLKSTMRTRDYLELGEKEGKTLLDAMKDGELDGMQHFDGELEKLVRAGAITQAIAYLNATNPGNLRVQLADLPDEDSLITR